MFKGEGSGRVRPSKAASAVGMVVGAGFAIFGLFVVMPMASQAGGFGTGFALLWTLIAVGIMVMNAANVFSEKGVATTEVDWEYTENTPASHAPIDEPKEEEESIEARLQELQSLLDRGLITQIEYDNQRTRILDDL